ncbi:hypothetical protein [Massilia sp. BJB1822]|uniref:hypothetical protein n=1 Tax=Massilia sp. BJB1822 TaxID=2744470 RepID=UPI00159380FB|nr:hypothetical protein [Massilia sp. BJB1822]NVE01012.1 hypothetical protein [Massilia sp. BJB1822]
MKKLGIFLFAAACSFSALANGGSAFERCEQNCHNVYNYCEWKGLSDNCAGELGVCLMSCEGL